MTLIERGCLQVSSEEKVKSGLEITVKNNTFFLVSHDVGLTQSNR